MVRLSINIKYLRNKTVYFVTICAGASTDMSLLSFALFTICFSLVLAGTELCGQSTFTEVNGTIQSPNYPHDYGDKITCTYEVSVPPGWHAYFRFKEFQTAENAATLTISCAGGTPFASGPFSGDRYWSTIIMPNCSRVKLLYMYNVAELNSTLSKGFSLVYSILRDPITEGFKLKPSNIFLQLAEKNVYTFNCTSLSGYLPWWAIYYKAWNRTLTNGFCHMTTNLSTRLISESPAPESCNLIASAPLEPDLYNGGVFVCSYGTSELAGAFMVGPPIDPGFQFSTRGGSSASKIADLKLKIDDELECSCDPKFLYKPDSRYYTREPTKSLTFSFLRRTTFLFVQYQILRSCWITQAGKPISTNDSTNSKAVVKVHSLLGHSPALACKVDVQIFSNFSFMDNSGPSEFTFNTDAIQVPYEPIKEAAIKITGDENGRINRGGVLSCYASALPPATYKWTDEATGEWIDIPIIAVTHSGEYTCTASNFINNTLYQVSKTIVLNISEEKNGGLNTPTIIQMVIVGLAILTVNVIISVALFCQSKRRSIVERTDTLNRPTAGGCRSDECGRYGYANGIHMHRFPSEGSLKRELYYEELQAATP